MKKEGGGQDREEIELSDVGGVGKRGGGVGVQNSEVLGTFISLKLNLVS